VRHIHAPKVISAAALCAAFTLIATPSGISYADSDKKDAISPSVIQQGFDSSPIPKEKLTLKCKDTALVGLGSYLVNSAGDCNGCHTFPRFLRPNGTAPGTGGNWTGNTTTRAATRSTAILTST
jgi:hypothetical protein